MQLSGVNVPPACHADNGTISQSIKWHWRWGCWKLWEAVEAIRSEQRKQQWLCVGGSHAALLNLPQPGPALLAQLQFVWNLWGRDKSKAGQGGQPMLQLRQHCIYVKCTQDTHSHTQTKHTGPDLYGVIDPVSPFSSRASCIRRLYCRPTGKAF